MSNKQSQKSMLAVSRGQYRGIDVFDTGKGVWAICLGFAVYSSDALSALTALIDDWLDLKKN